LNIAFHGCFIRKDLQSNKVLRYNPAVVAEAFASLSLLYPGRVFLGVGSGEALNEEVAIGS
jgi:alkanesulfonate monooxygenase SsuD/methylene tetrahydromethanopterin reductase-like flavin-dependent oxidoreductase (luciferase family)